MPEFGKTSYRTRCTYMYIFCLQIPHLIGRIEVPLKGLRCIGGEQLLELGLELHADADPEAACRVAAPQLPVQGRSPLLFIAPRAKLAVTPSLG